MAIPFQEFRKSFGINNPIDAYLQSSFQVFFDDSGRVEYIELSRAKQLDAFYKGVNVFNTKADDLVSFIQKNADYDATSRELGYSYAFPTLELSVWRPTMPESHEDEEGRYFSTIGIGTRGYFSQKI